MLVSGREVLYIMLKKVLSLTPRDNLYNGLWTRFITFISYIQTEPNKTYEVYLGVNGGWALQIYLYAIEYDINRNKLVETEMWRIYSGTKGTYTVTNPNTKFIRFYMRSKYSLHNGTNVNVIPHKDSYIKEVL